MQYLLDDSFQKPCRTEDWKSRFLPPALRWARRLLDSQVLIKPFGYLREWNNVEVQAVSFAAMKSWLRSIIDSSLFQRTPCEPAGVRAHIKQGVARPTDSLDKNEDRPICRLQAETRRDRAPVMLQQVGCED